MLKWGIAIVIYFSGSKFIGNRWCWNFWRVCFANQHSNLLMFVVSNALFYQMQVFSSTFSVSLFSRSNSNSLFFCEVYCFKFVQEITNASDERRCSFMTFLSFSLTSRRLSLLSSRARVRLSDVIGRQPRFRFVFAWFAIEVGWWSTSQKLLVC